MQETYIICLRGCELFLLFFCYLFLVIANKVRMQRSTKGHRKWHNFCLQTFANICWDTNQIICEAFQHLFGSKFVQFISSNKFPNICCIQKFFICGSYEHLFVKKFFRDYFLQKMFRTFTNFFLRHLRTDFNICLKHFCLILFELKFQRAKNISRTFVWINKSWSFARLANKSS